MKKTVLVTGGAGYIGSHACKQLALAGFVPVTYDNLSTGHAYAVKWGPFVQGDLNDRIKLDEAFLQYKPIAVLHFAAHAIVSESMQDPGFTYRNNVNATVHLLEAMRDHKVPFLVFSSTCATYGLPKQIPITEEHPQEPISPYGRSKWMIEQIIRDFERTHGIRCAMLRYFNVAGADFATEIGENHAVETHLIPSILQTAIGLRKEVIVYGTDFATKDGSAVRDYIHVQDLAEAHVKALQRLLSHQKSLTVNLGTGTGYSVFEILEAVQKFCGHPLSARLEKRREGDPPILVADAKKAFELLTWKPLHSDLPTLIESAWKWHKLLFDNAHLLKATLGAKEC